jgi:thioredoxin reductase
MVVVEVVTMTDELSSRYDVVVVGGGAAGLNGALMLVRSRRTVLVVDGGAPRNAPAAGVHGLLGHEGMPPAELLARGRAEVRQYGGQVVAGEVAAVGRTDDGFAVTLADGRSVGARRLLVASGVVDELPDVAGLRQRWGREVVHCPYCHGWEIRDQAIGVLASGPMSIHQALLFSQLSADVVYFTHTLPPADEEREQLTARGIAVVDGKVAALEIVDDRMSGVRLVDGTVVARAALAVSSRLSVRVDYLAAIGLRPVAHPGGIGEYLPGVDPSGRTDVPGVWVAGNVTDPMAQVGASAAGGAMAGARINADLVDEETRRAVASLARSSTRR